MPVSGGGGGFPPTVHIYHSAERFLIRVGAGLGQREPRSPSTYVHLLVKAKIHWQISCWMSMGFWTPPPGAVSPPNAYVAETKDIHLVGNDLAKARAGKPAEQTAAPDAVPFS